MENPSTTAELRSAEQERAYRAGKKVVNRELLKSFVFILFVLVLAVTVATVLAKGLNHRTEIKRCVRCDCDQVPSVDHGWSLRKDVLHCKRTHNA